MHLTIWWVLGITALTWHYLLFCGFISDDHAVIAGRRDIIPDHEKMTYAKKKEEREKYWIKVFNDGIVLFYLNEVMWKLFGANTFFWHLLSYSLHLVNTFLFYKVALMFCPEQIALCAALLWAVNPMQNQVVGWCSGRPYAISTLFALIIMLCWQTPMLTIPLYVLALITSVSVGFVPILLAISHPHTWQTNIYIAMLLASIPFVMWKFSMRFAQTALVLDRQNFHFRLRRFNNLVRIYMYYIFCLFFPVRMGWYHDAGFSYNEKWDGFNIWALAGYITVMFIATQGLFGWWFLLGMLPQMNLFATNSYVQDRYLYFGSMGFAILCAPFIIQYPFLVIAIAAIFASKAYTYSRHMIDDEHLYKENWRNHVKADYAINNLAFFLIQQRRYEEARAFCLRAIDINKENKLIWYNLGVTYAAQGNLSTEEGIQKFMKAIDCWKRSLQIEPRWNKPLNDMQKIIKLLIDNRILTTNKNEALPGSSAIHTPGMEKEAVIGTSNTEVGTTPGS